MDRARMNSAIRTFEKYAIKGENNGLVTIDELKSIGAADFQVLLDDITAADAGNKIFAWYGFMWLCGGLFGMCQTGHTTRRERFYVWWERKFMFVVVSVFIYVWSSVGLETLTVNEEVQGMNPEGEEERRLRPRG